MKKVTLHFACPIKWDEMKDSGERSKFCSRCKEHVTDFTEAEDLDTTGVKCGQFRMDQLSHIQRSFSIGKNHVVAFSLFSLLGLAPATGFAQNPTESDSVKVSEMVNNNVFHLKGVVRDSRWGHTMEGASVIIKETNGKVLQ